MRSLRIGFLSIAMLLGTSLHPPVSGAGAGEDFFVDVYKISPNLAKRMTGKSWHEGCPVPISDLRLIRVSYHDFEGERQIGRLVAHSDATDALVSAFEVMWNQSFKIRRMYLVDRYDANDNRSMRHDNTSAFNCRFVAGTTRWSEHAYGRAIDINPVENPYVRSDGSTSPKKGAPYADRSQRVKGLIHAKGPVVRAFSDAGWGWGGYWSSGQDYQHFSASGS